MKSLNALQTREMLRFAAHSIIDSKPMLTEIDGKIGDGDHGIGMELGMNKALEALEKLPEGSPVLFVGNHRSGFDPIVTMRILRKYKIVYISKPEVFDYPALGKIMHRCRYMAIDRENPRNAMKTICRAAELLGEGGVSVGVYPEGTRSKSGEILPFHNGVFKIAQKADVPIAVIALSGTEKVYKNPLRKNKVKLIVADVISADEVRKTGTYEIGERVRTALEAALSEAGE